MTERQKMIEWAAVVFVSQWEAMTAVFDDADVILILTKVRNWCDTKIELMKVD